VDVICSIEVLDLTPIVKTDLASIQITCCVESIRNIAVVSRNVLTVV